MTSECSHGLTFDEAEARKLSENWKPKDEIDFVMGDPSCHEVRKRWPRLHGVCPLGCGFDGIAYASYSHYIYGDW